MRRALLLASAALIAALIWLYWPSAPRVELPDPTLEEMAALVSRGEYVFRIAGCAGCHTQKDGPLLGGGRTLDVPFGPFVPPNISSDPKTGIGNWRFQDLVRALRYGRSPEGRAYLPVFPYTSYSGLQLEDMRALYAYLRTVAPVARASEPSAPWYLRGGVAARAWQRLFYTPAAPIEVSDTPSRGHYLATALGHCIECHTPRNRFGVPIDALAFAGTDDGPDGDPVPNITPDREHGIGKWRTGALREFFSSGMKPDGDFASGAMVNVIDYSTQYLTQEDAGALIAYLRSLPAIERTADESRK